MNIIFFLQYIDFSWFLFSTKLQKTRFELKISVIIGVLAHYEYIVYIFIQVKKDDFLSVMRFKLLGMCLWVDALILMLTWYFFIKFG